MAKRTKTEKAATAPPESDMAVGGAGTPGVKTGGEPGDTYEGLARRYRPQDFAAVVGQKHVVQTLRRALDARQWAHAYLFVGGRGLGKTTMARIVAKGINCDSGPTSHPCGECATCQDIAASRDIDVLEIDAASHTGVDNVRDLIIQSVATAPARGRAKIFIIDEVHMLSAAAFNALLKTIEEPPPGIVFILATTDGHKVPPTIRSRCQRFDFRPVTAEELVERLQGIAAQEQFAIEGDALELIAEHAEGGVRDALSALDLVRAYSSGASLTRADVEAALGLIPSRHLVQLTERLEAGDAPSSIELLGTLIAAGADVGELLRGLLGEFRRQLHAQLRGESVSSRGRIVRSIEAILATVDRSRNSRFPRLELESLLCRLAALREEEVTLRDLWARLQDLDPASGPMTRPPAAVGQEPAGSAAASLARAGSPPPQSSPAKTANAEPSRPATASADASANRGSSTGRHEPANSTSERPPLLEAASGSTPPPGSAGSDANAEVVEMLQRIFNAEVVEITKKS